MEFNNIYICSVWGEKHDMLPHFIHHYRKLGVNKFKFIIQAREKNDSYIKKMENYLQEYDINPKIYIGPWNGRICTELINNEKFNHPNDWFLIADQDELQLYPKPLTEIIYECDRQKLFYSTGILLDRVSINGELKKIEGNRSIWDQFPNCGFVSFPIARANPYKITLCKGFIKLSEGQHGVLIPKNPYPTIGTVTSQVHHFKWDYSLINRLNNRLEQQKKGDWKNSYDGYKEEVYKILDYLSHNKKISIKHPLFMIEPAGYNYADYKNWNNVKLIASSWSKLQSYPTFVADGT